MSSSSLTCPRPERGHLLLGVVVRQHDARAALEELGDLALGVRLGLPHAICYQDVRHLAREELEDLLGGDAAALEVRDQELHDQVGKLLLVLPLARVLPLVLSFVLASVPVLLLGRLEVVVAPPLGAVGDLGSSQLLGGVFSTLTFYYSSQLNWRVLQVA